MRYLGFVNIVLALGLVGMAIWLYGQEHETRQLERQIRKLEQATALEEETSRRLEVEWQALQRPDRIEALARQKLELVAPDPAVVMREDEMLARLPLRKPQQREVAVEVQTSEQRLGDAAAPASVQADAIGALIRATEGGQP